MASVTISNKNSQKEAWRDIVGAAYDNLEERISLVRRQQMDTSKLYEDLLKLSILIRIMNSDFEQITFTSEDISLAYHWRYAGPGNVALATELELSSQQS